MTRNRALVALAVALAAVALLVSARRPGRAPAAASGPPGTAVVTRVVDGDTIDVRLAGVVERVRLIGIDTPESVKPRTPVECFAKEASARTAALVPPGTVVRLVRDVEARDKYGRLLAYVYRARDGDFINLSLAREGDAGPLTIAPNVAHAEEVAAAVGQARQARLGLWGRCAGPHDPGPSRSPPAAARPYSGPP